MAEKKKSPSDLLTPSEASRLIEEICKEKGMERWQFTTSALVKAWIDGRIRAQRTLGTGMRLYKRREVIRFAESRGGGS